MPCRKYREMVGAGRILLEYVIPHVSFILPAFSRQALEQNLSFVLARWRHVNVCHHAEPGDSRARLRPDRKTVMHPLIAGAVVDRPEPGAELGGVLRILVNLKRR